MLESVSDASFAPTARVVEVLEPLRSSGREASFHGAGEDSHSQPLVLQRPSYCL